MVGNIFYASASILPSPKNKSENRFLQKGNKSLKQLIHFPTAGQQNDFNYKLHFLPDVIFGMSILWGICYYVSLQHNILTLRWRLSIHVLVRLLCQT